jgi:hypothetical protein
MIMKDDPYLNKRTLPSFVRTDPYAVLRRVSLIQVSWSIRAGIPKVAPDWRGMVAWRLPKTCGSEIKFS